MMPVETHVRRERLLTPSLTRPKENFEGTVKTYEPFIYGYMRYITNLFFKNMLKIAAPWTRL
jgi:hypothetical protein